MLFRIFYIIIIRDTRACVPLWMPVFVNTTMSIFINIGKNFECSQKYVYANYRCTWTWNRKDILLDSRSRWVKWKPVCFEAMNGNHGCD